MKITFTQDELSWLNMMINILLPVACKEKDADGGRNLRLLAKMRYKFTPNAAAYVSLTRTERTFLAQFTSHVLERGRELNALMPHQATMQSVLAKTDIEQVIPCA